MPAQVLVLKPDTELTFRGPFDKVVTSVLRLKNPSSDQVAFKVKTTAPKRYCVRPNSGTLQPGGEIEVSVMLQPSGGEPEPADRGSRHKFMVQSLLLPQGATGDPDEMWRSATPDRLMDSKLRVVLLEPEVQTATATTTAAAQAPSTQTTSAAKTSDSGEPLRELQAEVQRLKDENSRLADQELRLRKLAMRPPAESGSGGAAGGSGGFGQSSGGSSAGAVTAARSPAVPPALFLVLAMILGLIIGKFLL